LRTSADVNQGLAKLVPILLLLMTVAAGAIVVLAFQPWVDFGITEISGTEAEAATDISDGWAVVGLGSAILLFIGGVLFRPRWAPVLLPAIAFAAVCIVAIAGFDIVTDWHAAGVAPANPGVFVQAQGDPTPVPYVIVVLAVLIAVSAAVVRGVQLKEGERPSGEPAPD